MDTSSRYIPKSSNEVGKMESVMKNVVKLITCFALSGAIVLALCANASNIKADNQDHSNKVKMCKHEQRAEMGCSECHKAVTPKPLGTEECLSCHESTEEISKATKKLEINPHNSPHYGPDLDCDVCHHEHSKSENFCAQCHEWELNVP